MITPQIVFYVNFLDKYGNIIRLLEKKYKDVAFISDFNLIKKNLIQNTNNNIFILFIEDKLLETINQSLININLNRNFLILLSEKRMNLTQHNYFYDIINPKDEMRLNLFFNRLNRDIQTRNELTTLNNELKTFYKIGKEVSSEKQINKLLDFIINSSLDLTFADAGTIYVVVDSKTQEVIPYERNDKNKLLKFAITKNKSMQVELESTLIEISDDSIIGYTVINGEPLRISDVARLNTENSYQFNDFIDKKTGYKTKSLLTVPMKDNDDRVIGIIQLINKKKNDILSPFTQKDEMIIYSLAGQAAVALENSIIYQKMQKLIEKNRLTITEEIAKRKKADEEINKLLSTVEYSPVSVLITDIEGKIQYVNPKFTQLTGYEYSEVIGKKTNILKSGRHTKEFYEVFWKTILSGKEWRGEFYNKKKNGEFFWVNTSVSSIKDENGLIKYFITLREDVTEKKLLYKKLEDQNVKLQETIKKLNETQSQLVQKEKMAGIGQLAAGIAHEINNPLGFILSNFVTLQKYTLKFKQLILLYQEFIGNYNNLSNLESIDMLEAISNYEKQTKINFLLNDITELFNDTHEGLERVNNIVNALRTFSHIDQLKQFAEYNLNKGIENTLLIAKNTIKNKTKIDLDLGELPLFTANGGEINQVLLNLILNAAYAIEKKFQDSKQHGIIKIRTYHKETDIYFEVEDNGTGIKKEYLDHIFEPFFTTKPEGQGTGLGLSISYDIIVNKHKGNILVESKKGVGTKFIIKLPIK